MLSASALNSSIGRVLYLYEVPNPLVCGAGARVRMIPGQVRRCFFEKLFTELSDELAEDSLSGLGWFSGHEELEESSSFWVSVFL